MEGLDLSTYQDTHSLLIRQLYEEYIINLVTKKLRYVEGKQNIEQSISSIEKQLSKAISIDNINDLIEKSHKFSSIEKQLSKAISIDNINDLIEKSHQKRVKEFIKQNENVLKSIQSSDVFYDQRIGETGFPEDVQNALDKIQNVIGQSHLKEHFQKLCYKVIKQKRLKELNPSVNYGPSS